MPELITIEKNKFEKLLNDVEVLIGDVENILSEEDLIAKKRRAEIESGKVKGVSEAEYYNYLEKRGVKIGRMGN